MKMFINVLRILWRNFCNPSEESILGDYVKRFTNNIVFINALEKNFLNNLRFNYLIGCIYFLPEEVLERFKKENILIRFTTLEEIRSKNSNSKSIGYFTVEGKQKFIFVGAELSFWEIRNTLYHEIGNLIDRCKIEDIRYSNQVRGLSYYTECDNNFANIFNEEKDAISSEYHKRDVLEYFAQSFSYVMCNNKFFMRNATKTTNTILNYVATL